MPRSIVTEQALRLLVNTAGQPFVCRSCRVQAIRQFHTSPVAAAQLPFYKRIQETLFGTKESKAADKQREEKQQKKYEDLAQREDALSDLEIRTDSKGREYEVAALVDSTINKDYVPAADWKGLESVGSKQWVRERADTGDVYTG